MALSDTSGEHTDYIDLTGVADLKSEVSVQEGREGSTSWVDVRDGRGNSIGLLEGQHSDSGTFVVHRAEVEHGPAGDKALVALQERTAGWDMRRSRPSDATPQEGERRDVINDLMPKQTECVDSFGFPQDDAQRTLQSRDIEMADVMPVIETARDDGSVDYTSTVLEVRYKNDDGNVEARAIYKPSVGEYKYERDKGCPLRNSIEAGTQWRNEVAAYRVDKAVGFDLVPPTAPVEAQYGVGSLQEHVAMRARDKSSYDGIDRQRMGTLDYIIGNTDRHSNNWRTQDNGRPAAVDHGLSFPMDASDSLRSSFHDDVVNKALAPSIVEQLQKVDTEALRADLQKCGLRDEAISGALNRLEEAKTGRITGRAFEGNVHGHKGKRLK